MNIGWFSAGHFDEKVFFGAQPKNLIKRLKADEIPVSDECDLFVIDANEGKGQRTRRLGLDWLQKARYQSELLTPAIVYSFESYQELVKDYPVLNTKGVGFLRLPFPAAALSDFIKKSNLSPLSQVELTEIVRRSVGLSEKWEDFHHDFRRAVNNYLKNYKKVCELLERWSPVIRRFFPEQMENLKKLQTLSDLAPAEEQVDELRKVFNKLITGLKLSPRLPSKTTAVDSRFKKVKPPKYYSKILVANDDPDLPIVNSLKTYYGYDVLEQATNATKARRLFLEEKPQVVLADFYFKTPEEGLEFITFAADKKHKWSPLVLVNSYRDLSRFKLPEGVIDCSGEDSHTPRYIHYRIWDAANEDAFSDDGMEDEERIDLPPGILPVEYDSALTILSELIPALSLYITRWKKFRTEALLNAVTWLGGKWKVAAVRERKVIDQLLKILQPYKDDTDFSYLTINNLINLVSVIHEEISDLPDSEFSLNLRSVCHTIFSHSLADVERVVTESIAISERLNEVPTHQKQTDKILKLCQTFHQNRFNLVDAEKLLKNLKELVLTLPKPAQGNDISEIKSKTTIRLLVVEDDPVWEREFIFPVIEEAKRELQKLGIAITVESYNNTEDARNAVPKKENTRGIIARETLPVKTIAIVDLYLPATRREAEQLRKNKTNPARDTNPLKQNGLDLIKDLRSPARGDVRVIVLSTSGTNPDRLSIQRLGVSKNDHIIKGFKNKKTLIEALTRNITKVDKHRIEQLEEKGRPKFRIDGVSIELDNAAAEILETMLSLKSRVNITAADILSRLSKQITENSIKKSIYTIRKKIQQGFALQGMQIGDEDIIRTIPNFNGRKSAYMLTAESFIGSVNDEYIFDADGKLIPPRPCRVLIVENEPDILEILKARILTIEGVVVKEATNKEAAIQISRDFLPDIITLDLDIPRTISDFETNPSLSDKFAGLEAFEQIKGFHNSLKGILISTHVNDRMLRDRAAQAGISNENVVAKLSRDWLGSLLQKIKQLKNETIMGTKESFSHDVPPPVVKILDGCNFEEGILRLKVNDELFESRRSVRSKILALLLRSANKPVSYKKIEKHLGLTKVTINNRKTWASRLRTDILEKWLKLDESEQPGAEWILENSLSNGLILNVHIINPEKLR